MIFSKLSIVPEENQRVLHKSIKKGKSSKDKNKDAINYYNTRSTDGMLFQKSDKLPSYEVEKRKVVVKNDKGELNEINYVHGGSVYKTASIQLSLPIIHPLFAEGVGEKIGFSILTAYMVLKGCLFDELNVDSFISDNSVVIEKVNEYGIIDFTDVREVDPEEVDFDIRMFNRDITKTFTMLFKEAIEYLIDYPDKEKAYKTLLLTTTLVFSGLVEKHQFKMIPNYVDNKAFELLYKDEMKDAYSDRVVLNLFDSFYVMKEKGAKGKVGISRSKSKEKSLLQNSATFFQLLLDVSPKVAISSEYSNREFNFEEDFTDLLKRVSTIIITGLNLLPIGLREEVNVNMDTKHPVTKIYDKIIDLNNSIDMRVSLEISFVLNKLKNMKEVIYKFLDSSDNEVMASVADMRNEYKGGLITLPSMMMSKYGHARSSMLYVRVDLSGRSVIGSDPTLRIDEISVPRKMLKEIFKVQIDSIKNSNDLSEPSITRRHSTHFSDKYIDSVFNRNSGYAYAAIGRQPTLHILSIGGFIVIPNDTNTIKLHPLNTAVFNADFDGDQMHITFFLGEEANMDLKKRMLSSRNLFWSRDGSIQHAPKQEIIYGLHLLRTIEKGEKVAIIKKYLEDSPVYNVMLNVINGDIELDMEYQGTSVAKYISKNMFLYAMERVRKNVPESFIADLEKYSTMDVTQKGISLANKLLQQIAEIAAKEGKEKEYVELNHYMTRVALKAAFLYPVDLSPLTTKVLGVGEFESEMADTYKELRRLQSYGLITSNEYASAIRREFNSKLDKKRSDLKKEFESQEGDKNGFFLLGQSGAKGGPKDWSQLYLAKGYVQRDGQSTFDMGVSTSFLRGMSTLDQLMLSYGGRQGMIDKSVNTYKPGELTFNLVANMQREKIVSDDCGCTKGFKLDKELFKYFDSKNSIAGDSQMRSMFYTFLEIDLPGRYVFLRKGDDVEEIYVNSVDKVKSIIARLKSDDSLVLELRSILTCLDPCCVKCYGKVNHTGRMAEKGLAIGILGGTTITEPITQLSMKSFQAGGVADNVSVLSNLDWMQKYTGLALTKDKNIYTPIEEDDDSVYKLLSIKGDKAIYAKYSQVDGKLYSTKKKLTVSVLTEVRTDVVIKKGEPILQGIGRQDLRDVFEQRGFEEARRYLLIMFNRLFFEQGVNIGLKHFEVLVNSMTLYLAKTNSIEGFSFGKHYTRREALQRYSNEELEKIVEEGGIERILTSITRSVKLRGNFVESLMFKDGKSHLPAILLRGDSGNVESPLAEVALGLKPRIGDNYEL